MGGVFVSVFGYADDLKMLTSSEHAMCQLAEICQKYAAKYEVICNGKKRQH